MTPLPPATIEPELEPNMANLVNALNAFEAIQTIGSCGGHDDPGPAQWPAGTWYVKFQIDKTSEGWMTVEFLGWAINNSYARQDGGHAVQFQPTAPPPYLNQPGEMLMWVIEGYDNEDPDQLARLLGELLEDYHISTEEEERITVDRRQYERLPRCVRRRLANGS